MQQPAAHDIETSLQWPPFSCKFPLQRDKKWGFTGWQKTKPNNHAYMPYGIAIQDDEIVLDFDPRNYPIDPITEEPIDPWFGEYGDPGLRHILPSTYMVRTPSGGYHLYYTKPPDIKISQKQPLYPGVDFQGKGQLVVGAGSQIKGGIYQAYNSKELIVPIPISFLRTLQAPDKTNPIAADNFEDDDPLAINNYKAWLGICPEAIEGKGGDATTLKTAYYGRDMGLSSYATLQAMCEVYNPRCQPPWDEDELERKIYNAYCYAKGSQGSKAPMLLLKMDHLLNAAAPLPAETETVKKIKALRFDHLQDNYVLDSKGAILINNITNTRIVLEDNADFKDLLWYDEMSHRVRWEGKPWWRFAGNLDVNDDDILHIYGWINSKAVTTIDTGKKGSGGYRCSEETVRAAVRLVASKRSRNPLTHYLDSLAWDGTERLNSYLVDTCGSPDDDWTRIAGRKWLIGAVTRAYEPGCQMDYILVLQGDQGIRKSKWIEVLGGEYASACQLNPEDKDTHMKMLGTWIMEVPEMNRSLRKHDLDLIKAFITVREDNFRKPFDRIAQRVPRLTVFIGSLNPTEMGFLKDITGDRRYWPVLCKECEPDKLKKIRDQLLAEAVQAYKLGERSELSPDEIVKARAAQNEVVENDPWYPILYQKVGGQDKIHILDVYNLLGLTNKDITTITRGRVYHSLRQLGYKFERATQNWIKL